ncbi:MAG: YmdB family metallophosphoesterase [Planctomycetes bacterium]|nr:YmdB family metallophosphoesterase [Planctomycetota bacterium]
MKILFVGDIVGQPGVDAVRSLVPLLITQESLDLVVVNAENVCGGSGLTPRQYRQVRGAGVDLITMGDHIYRRSEILPVLNTEDRICKPANFPRAAPGREWILAPARNGVTVAAFALLGRTFMRPVDCPFQAADRVLADLKDRAAVILVDMHAEATSDKYLMGHYLKGRVSAVLGTHTHVPTADEQLLGTTAFISDVGMTGPHESILGRRVERVLSHALDFVPAAFDVATGDVRLSGAIVEVDAETGHALAIRRLQVRMPDGP